MSNIDIYGGGVPSRDVRRAGRTISRHEAQAQVRISQIDLETDATLAKIEGNSTSVGSAMSAVMRVGQLQNQLELMNPALAGRLAGLADEHQLAMHETLSDLRRELRRK